MISAFLVSIPFIIFISLSVFGGGQVFMPIFKWLWEFLAKSFDAKIDNDLINKIFTVANSTPGVVSTKFGFYTGYIVANGAWWGYVAMFITYLIFCLPAIMTMFLAMKYVKKFKSNTLVKNMLILMKPIVAGIIISLAVQLFISIYWTNFEFNKGIDKYFLINKETNSIFIGYRNILLKIYVPVGIVISYFLARKKFSLFIIIIINIAISLFLFAIPFA
ncbi:chromate transporter [Mycoplasma leonicaptivi]|uniref:chromate transporter n=1 Tax=Mycoplasma leonicaptivi TaxID=36742 RepID=UPI0004825A58|nr:chromate transporter [Mycoplasma leonicaptivi]